MHIDAVVAHILRQLRLGLGLAHLRQHLVGVRVGLHIEIDPQRHLPVVGVDGVHVVHVVHAGHLLLDGRGDRLLHRDCVRAGVGGLDLDFRRGDFGKLGDGQAHHRHDADDHHQDGDHHGHDGPVDKKFGHDGLPCCASG